MITATTAGLCRLTTEEDLAAALAAERSIMEQRHAAIDAAGGDPDEIEMAHLAVDDADWQFVRDLDLLDTACSDLAARFAAFDVTASHAADAAGAVEREAARTLLLKPRSTAPVGEAWRAAEAALRHAGSAMRANRTPDPDESQRMGDRLLEAAQALFVLAQEQRRLVDAAAERRKAEALLAQPTTDGVLAQFAEENRRLCAQVAALKRRVPAQYAP